MRSRWVGSVILVGFAVAGCGGGDEPVSVVGASTPTTTGAPTVAAELAPSQTTPGTVDAPDLPPPCTADQLEYSASSPLADGGLVLRVTNTGAEWCEAGFGASPIISPGMEPDVWLDPGAAGEMSVAVESTSCDAPAPVDSVGLVMNGEPVAVPVDPIEACTLSLIALYPVVD